MSDYASPLQWLSSTILLILQLTMIILTVSCNLYSCMCHVGRIASMTYLYRMEVPVHRSPVRTDVVNLDISTYLEIQEELDQRRMACSYVKMGVRKLPHLQCSEPCSWSCRGTVYLLHVLDANMMSRWKCNSSSVFETEFDVVSFWKMWS